LRLSKAAEVIGVTEQTLRVWDKEGKLRTVRTAGNQRRVPIEEVERLTCTKENIRDKVLIYARCSTQKQKENLERQVGRLLEYAISKDYKVELYKDIGSGLNENRAQFKKLLKRLGDSDVEKVLLEYKDRLCRYGFTTFESYCTTLGVSVEVLEKKESIEFEQEFAEDIVALVTSYSARLYGRRGGRGKKNKIT
jgi:excisionase family DNA binding protein